MGACHTMLEAITSLNFFLSFVCSSPYNHSHCGSCDCFCNWLWHSNIDSYESMNSTAVALLTSLLWPVFGWLTCMFDWLMWVTCSWVANTSWVVLTYLQKAHYSGVQHDSSCRILKNELNKNDRWSNKCNHLTVFVWHQPQTKHRPTV